MPWFAPAGPPEENATRQTMLKEDYTEEHKFVNQDGYYLWKEIWRPKSSHVRAIVFIVHGYGEHCNTYVEPLVRHLQERDILVLSHDHLCHGRSEGEHLYFTDVHVFSRDVLDHLSQFLAASFPSPDKYPPIFLYGHSLGGQITVLAALEKPNLFARGGVILSSPLIRAAPETATPLRLFAVRCLANIAPRTPIAPLDLRFISRDPAVAKDVLQDPLSYLGAMKAGVGAAMFRALGEVESNLGNYRPATLLLNGTDDKLTHVSGVTVFQEKAVNCEELQVELFEGAYHQLLRELPDVTERHLKCVLDWLEKRISRAETADHQ